MLKVNKVNNLTASPLREKLLPRAVVFIIALQLIATAFVGSGG